MDESDGGVLLSGVSSAGLRDGITPLSFSIKFMAIYLLDMSS